MAKSSKSKKQSGSVGKGKVTPVQVAFIVEQFLADNNYTNTIAAFRSEASDLFSKTKGKEVPKGLLGLGDILEEYISLKEQRMAVDQEKRKVETAFQGLQDVMRAYHTPQSPPLLLPPHIVTTPNVGLNQGSNPSNGSPSQGHMIHGPSVSCAQPSVLLPIEETNRYSTPLPNCSGGEKRKAASLAPKLPPPPKKFRAGSTKTIQMMEGTSQKVPCRGNTQASIENTSAVNSVSAGSVVRSPVQGYSIAKSLFKNAPDFRANSSSPKTPPQELQCQNDKSATPTENSTLNACGASSSQNIVPSNCAITTSERIIISPIKHTGYYAFERSYHVSTSPLKSSPEIMYKREHVKGRLDFDASCAPQSSEEPVAAESSPSTTDGEAAGGFDFELPDFDMFDGDLSKLLGDFDLECEQAHSCQKSSAPADFHLGSEQNVGDINQALPNPCMSTVTEIVSQKDMNFQGRDTMATMRSITKRIMISSPSKARSSCSSEQTHSTA